MEVEYPERYFDEFRVGDTFDTPESTLSLTECLEFARCFDPQPFHLDEHAAKQSLFRKLSVSGWHTAAVTMRLIVQSGFLRAPGVLGVGVDELRWIAPVYPGDSLRVKGEVLELLPDPEGKPRGRMRARISTINQNGAVVMTYIANLSLVSRRYLEQVQPTGSQAAFRANM